MQAQGLDNVTVLVSDGFKAVTGQYQVVISNPPWISLALPDPNRQWATSGSLIPSLFKDSGRFLVDGGVLAISCPAAARDTLVDMAASNGFALKSTHLREKNRSLRVRLLTLLYLQVGFHPLVYVFHKQGAALAG